MLTPGQVKEYRFQSAGQGVYRADEVDNYFQTVGDAYEKIYKDNGELIRKINMLADKVKAYQDEEELIKKTLLVAQKKADEIETTSKQRSEEMISAAEKQSAEKTAYAEKRARDLLAAAEDRARKTLADANQKSSDTLHGASETAEKTVATAKNKAITLLTEAKNRAEKILAEAQEKADSILGSLKDEVASEQKALETVRAQSKEFKKKITESYYEQIGMTSQLLGFVETEDGISENAAKAAAEVKPAEKAEPITVEEPELPEVDTSFIDLAAAPTYEPSEEDDLFTAILEETVFPEDTEEPKAEESTEAPDTAEPEEAEPAEESGFSFVGGFGGFGDFAQDDGYDAMEDEIPEVPLAGIDDIFSSELEKKPEPEQAPIPEPVPEANPLGELKEKYKAVAVPEQQEPEEESPFGAFSRKMEISLPDDEPEEPTRIMEPISYEPIPVAEPAQQPAEPAAPAEEEKHEKKKHRLSLFSKYEDDDEEDEDEDDEDDEDDDDEEEGGFRGFFRR